MITFEREPSYMTALQTTMQGLQMLGTITAKHIMNHKAFVLLIFSVLINITQFATVAGLRIERDRNSVAMYQITQKLDSINCTAFKYYRYK